MSNLDGPTDAKKAESTPLVKSSASKVSAVSRDFGMKNNTFKDQITKINVNFGGPLKSFAGNSATRTFTNPTAARNAFKPPIFNICSINGADDSASQVPLEKAIIKAIRVSHTRSTFPCDVTMDLEESGVPSSCFGLDGTPCAFVIRSGECGNRNDYQDIYLAQDITNDIVLQRYAHIDTEKLKEGIVNVPGTSYSIVKADHDIMGIIRLPRNEQTFGYKAADLQSMGDGMLKVPTDLVQKSISELSRTVVSSIKFNDLSQLTVKMNREDGKNFTDLSSTHYSNLTHPADQKDILDKHFAASCTLEIKWTYPCQDNADVSSVASPVTRSPNASAQVSKTSSKVPVATRI